MATPALPDVNAETYPFEMVQYLLDQTGNFNVYAIPARNYDPNLTGRADDYFGLQGGYGLDLRCSLHHFDASFTPESGGYAVTNQPGREAGEFTARLMFGSGGFPWTPEADPPEAVFDPWRSQRFALRNAAFRFGERDSFLGYAIGRTYPVDIEGSKEILVTATGNVMSGTGIFEGMEGSFTLNGRLTASLGYAGNMTIRIVDPAGRFHSDRDVMVTDSVIDPDPEAAYFVMRLDKPDSSYKTQYGPPPGGGMVSLLTPSQIRTVDHGFTTRLGLRTQMRTGQVTGAMLADVHFDLLAPPGTAERPVPFTTKEVYTFTDGGGTELGRIFAQAEEGFAYALRFPAAPGQPGVRFAGVGPVTGGTGCFEGAQGLLTVNSVIGIAPHTLSLMHVLHLRDRKRKFRRSPAIS